MPCGFSLSPAGCIIPEMEVGDTLFIRYQLAVPPGGQGLVPQDTAEGGERGDEPFKLGGIMPFP
jgi:hypothetical protein